MRSVKKENGVGTGSPGCSSNRDHSIVRPSRRGGVPVFNRVHCKAKVLNCAPSVLEGASPFRPQAYRCSPTCARPFKKVPVVTITACESKSRPSFRRTPVIWRDPASPLNSSSPTSACKIRKFASCSSHSRIRIRYCFLSHCARGDQTAGPRLVFRRRN